MTIPLPIAKTTGLPGPDRAGRQAMAFTLVELLVVVAIIGILATLLLAASQRAIGAADSVKCAANLRLVGQAVTSYVNDNSFMVGRPTLLSSWTPVPGQLPGPLNGGQHPWSCWKYKGMLGYFLSPYLGLPEPTGVEYIVPVLQCPAWKKKTTQLDGVSYLAPNSIVYGGVTNAPFGRVNSGTGYPDPAPSRMVALPPVALSSIAVLQDVDKKNVSAGPDWYPPLPDKPVHNGKRNTVYLDGHVETQ